MKQENTQHITKIIIKPYAVCFCPLGNDWYTNNYEIVFTPGKYYPDYCDIEVFLDKRIRGQSLIIEDTLQLIYEWMQKEYAPERLIITAKVNNANSHSPVEVTIGD